jgi:hypothetical protein
MPRPLIEHGKCHRGHMGDYARGAVMANKKVGISTVETYGARHQEASALERTAAESLRRVAENLGSDGSRRQVRGRGQQPILPSGGILLRQYTRRDEARPFYICSTWFNANVNAATYPVFVLLLLYSLYQRAGKENCVTKKIKCFQIVSHRSRNPVFRVEVPRCPLNLSLQAL